MLIPWRVYFWPFGHLTFWHRSFLPQSLVENPPKMEKNKKVYFGVEFISRIHARIIYSIYSSMEGALSMPFFPYKDYVRKLPDFLWIRSPPKKIRVYNINKVRQNGSLNIQRPS